MLAAVDHLANLDAISSSLDLIAQKHCALGVQASHYKIVHDNFLAATAKVLGDAITPDVAEAWSQVRDFVRDCIYIYIFVVLGGNFSKRFILILI